MRAHTLARIRGFEVIPSGACGCAGYTAGQLGVVTLGKV